MLFSTLAAVLALNGSAHTPTKDLPAAVYKLEQYASLRCAPQDHQGTLILVRGSLPDGETRTRIFHRPSGPPTRSLAAYTFTGDCIRDAEGQIRRLDLEKRRFGRAGRKGPARWQIQFQVRATAERPDSPLEGFCSSEYRRQPWRVRPEMRSQVWLDPLEALLENPNLWTMATPIFAVAADFEDWGTTVPYRPLRLRRINGMLGTHMATFQTVEMGGPAYEGSQPSGIIVRPDGAELSGHLIRSYTGYFDLDGRLVALGMGRGQRVLIEGNFGSSAPPSDTRQTPGLPYGYLIPQAVSGAERKHWLEQCLQEK